MFSGVNNYINETADQSENPRQRLIASVIDTGDKFVSGVVDTAKQFIASVIENRHEFMKKVETILIVYSGRRGHWFMKKTEVENLVSDSLW